jgi:excisionase family DNA binding protein
MRTNATLSRTLRSATTRPAARRGAASCTVEGLDELKARGVAVVTKAQIAAAFQVSERTITKMMGRKEIPFFRLGERLVRFRVEEAIKHMEGRAGVVR